MADNEVILRVSTVALLVGFLIYKQWERSRQRAAIRRRVHRDGDVIDVAPLRPRLQAVRRSYATVAHARSRGIPARDDLVAGARRRLSRLPFFRADPAPPEGEHHIA